MKKVLALVAVAFGSLVATSAHVLPTTLMPGTPGQPYQTTPGVSTGDQAIGQTSFNGRQLPATYKAKKARSIKTTISDKKEARQEMKMQKKADKAGSL